MMDIKSLIRTIPDFPKPGVLFRDITTLLKHTEGFRSTIDQLVGKYRGVKIDKVAGIESRGFIIGAALAYQLKAGFVPIR
ncbi:MAG: purine phosphoribosyltransferase family protein, partial [Burkholderiales bacterium]